MMLQGIAYAEETLFHGRQRFHLDMDVIECGIVKLPLVPVAEDISGNEMPTCCDLWEYNRKAMPKHAQAGLRQIQGTSFPPSSRPPWRPSTGKQPL